MQIVVFDGVDELDFVAPFEVLSAVAAAVGDGSEIRLVALDAPRVVTTAHGMRISVDTPIQPDGDVLIVPGGGWAGGRSNGVRAEVGRGALPAVIRDLASEHSLVASVCTGAMVLEAAGLLEGRTATTHASALEHLAAAGVHTVNARVVDDGELITGGGVTSGLDLALHLAERLWGAEAANREERRLEYKRRGDVWRR